MAEWLQELTLPQATLYNGILTGVAAVTGVLLGWFLFKGKVTDLRSAISEAQSALMDHREKVTTTLEDIEFKLSSLSESLAMISAENADKQILERQDVDVHVGGFEAKTEVGSLSTSANEVNEIKLLELEAEWKVVRGKLEQIASDPKIDGRTAAKYSRIDRRQYADLIAALEKDKRIIGLEGDYRAASKIWSSYRNRRKSVEQADVDEMKRIARKVASG